MTEVHHFVPIGLMGLDVPQNCAPVEIKLHRSIHDKMNIPFRRYSQVMRTYRRRFNGRSTMQRDQVHAILKMQIEYLNKYPSLCPKGQKAYVKTMNKYLCWLRAQKGHKHQYQPRWGAIMVEYMEALSNYYLL